MADRIRVVDPNGETKKTKEKPLKEITNKLVAQPVNLKPSWAGLRQSLEKSKGNVGEKLNLCVNGGLERGPGTFNIQPRPTKSSANSGRVGQHEPRPLDLTQ